MGNMELKMTPFGLGFGDGQGGVVLHTDSLNGKNGLEPRAVDQAGAQHAALEQAVTKAEHFSNEVRTYEHHNPFEIAEGHDPKSFAGHEELFRGLATPVIHHVIPQFMPPRPPSAAELAKLAETFGVAFKRGSKHGQDDEELEEIHVSPKIKRARRVDKAKN